MQVFVCHVALPPRALANSSTYWMHYRLEPMRLCAHKCVCMCVCVLEGVALCVYTAHLCKSTLILREQICTVSAHRGDHEMHLPLPDSSLIINGRFDSTDRCHGCSLLAIKAALTYVFNSSKCEISSKIPHDH